MTDSGGDSTRQADAVSPAEHVLRGDPLRREAALGKEGEQHPGIAVHGAAGAGATLLLEHDSSDTRLFARKLPAGTSNLLHSCLDPPGVQKDVGPDRNKRSRKHIKDEVVRRGVCHNRLDDANEAVICQRLETYDCETKPVLDYYQSIVTRIDALQPPIKVLHDIIASIWSNRNGTLTFHD